MQGLATRPGHRWFHGSGVSPRGRPTSGPAEGRDHEKKPNRSARPSASPDPRQQGARRQPARRSDRARAACLHAARLQGRRAPAAAGGRRRLHRLGHGPHQLEGLHRECAGAAGPADRRRQDGAGGGRLPGLLFAPRRQSIHQLGRDGTLRGLSDPGDRALRRGPLLSRRPRQSRHLRQIVGRVRRHHPWPAPRRFLVGAGLPFRRHGVRALLSARHAEGAERTRQARPLDREVHGPSRSDAQADRG